jgi:hypothetical protein
MPKRHTTRFVPLEEWVLRVVAQIIDLLFALEFVQLDAVI